MLLLLIIIKTNLKWLHCLQEITYVALFMIYLGIHQLYLPLLKMKNLKKRIKYLLIVWPYFSAFSTILLGAKKDGNGYKWTNGNKAYFMVADVTDSSIGECVVIDRTSGALKGIDCAASHSILCQQG